MILTKISLELRHPSVRQCLRNCQDMHRNLMSAFGGMARAENSLLYRLVPRKDSVDLYLSSEKCPHAEALGKNGFTVVAQRSLDPLKKIFVAGSRWRFDLVAMPGKKENSERKNSRRVFLRTPEERAAWLTRKGEQNGFRVLGVQEWGESNVWGSRGDSPLSFVSVHFSGVLEVTDSGRFWSGYCHGIGAERAYGMGMLLITRP
ncbi:type I-E CRISPR-associated protein Cas6/Cse3/CasE [Pyramidobacter sp. SM-530-WT-4B]|uniref:Type I-E CRISPR-associated protein Cas6/Cse3/CasE n=1 Tax=Pyramidobacter porci TaxID=2605789 RepID=A0A6L5YFB2_9BACT|nr:type I-E CRISPR-associated protein Cas6/Cse3/CasE [Pyramidobacter porci]MST56312.1 type I-E CRISPR-associated protein Cas6/Cse3/CasE [Pyramidobacter porci]